MKGGIGEHSIEFVRKRKRARVHLSRVEAACTRRG